MVLTVFVLNLYGIADRPVPKSLKRLVFCQLAKLLRMDDSIAFVKTQESSFLEKVGVSFLEFFGIILNLIKRRFEAIKNKRATLYLA